MGIDPASIQKFHSGDGKPIGEVSAEGNPWQNGKMIPGRWRNPGQASRYENKSTTDIAPLLKSQEASMPQKPGGLEDCDAIIIALMGSTESSIPLSDPSNPLF